MRVLACLFLVLLLPACKKKEAVYEAPSSNIVIAVPEGFDKGYVVMHNGYGTLSLFASRRQKVYVPEVMAKRAGVLWYRVYRQDGTLVHKSEIDIAPEEAAKVEVYAGPPQLLAGENDFSMLVALPIDRYDNPLPNGDTIWVKHQFGNQISEENLVVQNSIGWMRIFSHTKTGRIQAMARAGEGTSKEVSLHVFANKPEPFEIRYSRPHDFADGNALLQLETGILKDAYGNTVSNGTHLRFHIKSSLGTNWQVNASTIHGIAQAQVLYPDEPQTWVLRAEVPGIAKSNELTLKFGLGVADYAITQEGRQLLIGPITGHLGQEVAEGTRVNIALYDGKKLISQHTVNTERSYGRYTIPPELELLADKAAFNVLGLKKTIALQ